MRGRGCQARSVHRLPGVRIRVAHADTGAAPAAADAIGTLEIKGPNVFAGYWRDAEKTRRAFTADGWFRTGDLGLIDTDGYVHIVGRDKDLVISGGYNVYPKEVESELDALPGVAGERRVRRAASGLRRGRHRRRGAAARSIAHRE